MPFLYAQPERFRIGSLPAPADALHGRYTVDTDDDLTFVRTLAARLPQGQPVHLADLEAIVRAEPDLASLNATVRQKAWREIDDRSSGRP